MARLEKICIALIFSSLSLIPVLGVIFLPTPRIVFMGPTGSGKSTLANVLMGHSFEDDCTNCTFPICHSLNSCTKNTTYAIGQWLGNQSEFTVVDTPGFADSDNDGNSLIDEMMTTLKDDVQDANALVLLMNGKQERFTTDLQQMIRQMQALFGERMWNNTIIGVSHWSYNAYEVRRRKMRGETEAKFLKQVNDQLVEKFHIAQPLDGVFIDAMSQSIYDIDDQDQQIAYQRETTKLWNFSQNTDLFTFKTVEDVLEENQFLKEEVGRLNDIIANNITELRSEVDSLRKETHLSVANVNTDILLLRENGKKAQDENMVRFGNLSYAVSENQKQFIKFHDEVKKNITMSKAPLGTIMAWVNRPSIDTPRTENLPEGWVRCDGKMIPHNSPSIWAGQYTPNLNGEQRFLRGGSDSVMLHTQEDSLQSHTHGVYDPGHSHSYVDRYPNWGHGDAKNGAGDYIDDTGRDGPAHSDKDEDAWDDQHTGIATYSSAANVKVTNVQGANVDSETRPKNMKVVYVMRIY